MQVDTSGGPGERRASSSTPSTNTRAPQTPPIAQSPIASLHPLILRPWFIISNAILLLAVAFGAIARRLSARRSRDPERLAHEVAARSIRACLASMDDAEKKCDGPGFFLAARHALQEQLAEQWRIAPSQVTGPLITQRLNGNGENLRQLLRTADEASYSRRAFTTAELKQWHDAFAQELHRIRTL